MRVLGDISLFAKDEGAESNPRAWFRAASRIVLFVHGYRVKPDDVHVSYQTFAEKLDSWPSGQWWGLGRVVWHGTAQTAIPLLDVFSYPFKPKEAVAAGKRLATLIERMRGAAGSRAEVCLVAHSLGCRVVFEALRLLPAPDDTDGPKLRLVAAMAAAVPTAELTPGGHLRPRSGLSRYLLVLYSPGDAVLRFAFPAGQPEGRAMGERRVYWRALGLYGEPQDLTHHRYRNFGNDGKPAGHGQYWTSTVAAEHVARYLGVPSAPRVATHALDEHVLYPERGVAKHDLPVRRGLNAW